MMEIVTLQRRLVEVGRIRLGQKKTTANGKQYPARLEHFRLTSRDRQRLDAAASLYGGEVRKWENAWELFTETDVLPVAVVPGQALSQSFELWGQKPLPGGKKTGVICLRRCDGQTEYLSGDGCLCAGEVEPACKPMTRLSVVLTEVPGIGVWRVEAHGWNAASELAGCVQLLEALVATGRPVRARLRLDAREQVTENETRRFVVPVLDIDHTLGQVMDSIGAGPTQQIGGGAVAALPAAPSFTPVPVEELAAGPQPSVAEQVSAMNDPAPRRARANAQVPLPSTGAKPRTAAQAAQPTPAGVALTANGVPVCGQCGGSLAGHAVKIEGGVKVHKDGCPPQDSGPDGPGVAHESESQQQETNTNTGLEREPSDAGAEQVPAAPAQSDEPVYRDIDIHKLAGEVFAAAKDAAPRGQKSKVIDRCRHALTWGVTKGRATSLKELTAHEKHRLWMELSWLRDGVNAYEVTDDALVITHASDDREVVIPFEAIDAATAA